MSADRTAFTCGLAALLLLLAARAGAQSAAAADALFEEGRAALERGELDVACPKLEESDRLDPANGTKFNLADCQEKRGKVATAWALYRKLSDSLPADDERLPYAKEHAAALDSRVPHVVFRLAAGAPPDTQARLGTLLLTTASFGTSLPVDPGEQDIVVSSGSHSRTYSVSFAEGEEQILSVTPNAEVARPSPTARVGVDARAARDRRTLSYVADGVGAAGLVVGAVAGLMGLHQESVGNDNCSVALKRCNQTGFDANQSARSLATVSTIGFAAGIVGFGVGTYFLLTSGPDRSVAVGARLNGESASLALGGKW